MTNVHEDPEVLKVCCPDCGGDFCLNGNPEDEPSFEPQVGERAFCEACGFEFVVTEKDLVSEREIGEMNLQMRQG